MNQLLRQQVRQTLDRLRVELLQQRTVDGHWEGELAGSALSTATAVSAISAVLLDDESSASDASGRELINRGVEYLSEQQNEDGGFGDTDLSHSNIATSYLVLAASTLSGQSVGNSLSQEQLSRLRSYIDGAGGIIGLRRRYGKDKTFVVPIMCNMAIAGLIDWDEVQALPFEAAVFPQSMYRFLQMPVVSYAIPALVAIGQARHFLGRRALPPLRWIRSASVAPTMKVLERMQPDSGGYLEATPLTSFVLMSLAATGRGGCAVAKSGMKFLEESIRENGSWPIDTNLATWVTSLAIHALACDPEDDGAWCQSELIDWHLSCQHVQRHPFTGADPGGWGWTDLSGAVPDADDTPGAILALSYLRRYASTQQRESIDLAIIDGQRWLNRLQNRNGGWPTFCRGWGKLPFDRSSTDLTAHAIRALGDKVDSSRKSAAERFLAKQQRPDGSWLPLWFGNQDLPDEINPVYGTSRVLLADLSDQDSLERARAFLVQNQNPDGGWGGGGSLREKIISRFGDSSDLVGGSVADGKTEKPTAINCPNDLISSVEETALAVEALCTIVLKERDLAMPGGVASDRTGSRDSSEPTPAGQMRLSDESLHAGGKIRADAAIISGVEFLLRSVDDERHRVAWPIGFYFAKLWYHEQLYPLVFATAALGKYLRATADQHDSNWPR